MHLNLIRQGLVIVLVFSALFIYLKEYPIQKQLSHKIADRYKELKQVEQGDYVFYIKDFYVNYSADWEFNQLTQEYQESKNRQIPAYILIALAILVNPTDDYKRLMSFLAKRQDKA